VWLLSLYHPAHEALRAANPRRAESLAMAVLRALSERFDLIDKYTMDFLARHLNEPRPRGTGTSPDQDAFSSCERAAISLKQ
jgi:hypothetical protein